MEKFEIPIVLLMFKREKAIIRIIERIKRVKPTKIYLVSDEGRSLEERELVKRCRIAAEKSINWDCEVIKNYAETNRGVYGNIALGAKWVLEREESAIFLEDDNLPEVSFFQYCKELLDKYKNNEKILWICGTNYLGQYTPEEDVSYMFTKQLLPCGWASWGNKFLKYYDGELKLAENIDLYKILKDKYDNKPLFEQQYFLLKQEQIRKNKGERFHSWDYQMAFSIRINDMYGISPVCNQIKNIGVDEFSEHGGSSFDSIMTQRFCGMDSCTIEFPLKHPTAIREDVIYEKKIESLILYPRKTRIRNFILKLLKRILGLSIYEPFPRYKNK